jgi:sulfur dioxygenase
MASIEVSLSTTPRRKKNGSIGGGGGCGVAGVGTVTAVVGGPPVHRPITSKDIAKELEVLRNAVRDKENLIQR